MNKNKYYYLSLKDKIIIEEELDEQISFKKIVKDINKAVPNKGLLFAC